MTFFLVNRYGELSEVRERLVRVADGGSLKIVRLR